MCVNPPLLCFTQTLQKGEKIVGSDNGAFLYSKRAPEMTNDCGLKQAETEKEKWGGGLNVFIRNYTWMVRSAASPFSAML